MNQLKIFVIWLLRAWPFIVISIIAIFHYEILKLCSQQGAIWFNKIMSAFTQVIGGLIVLSTVNAKLGLFKQKGLLIIFVDWLKSWPLFRHKTDISGQINVIGPMTTVSMEGHVSPKCNTIEEKIEEAMRQIDDLRRIVYRKESELLFKINETDNSLKQLIARTQEDVNKLNGLLTKSTVGGIKLQIFGVLLVIYGALFPLILSIK
jgi:hypothetical protein